MRSHRILLALLLFTAMAALTPLAGDAQPLFGGTSFGPTAVSPPKITAFTGRAVVFSVTGSLTVSFRGDRASRCARRGVCGISGVTVVIPSQQTQALITTYRLRGQRVYQGSFEGTSGSDAARVSTPGGICTDGASGTVTGDVVAAGSGLAVVPISPATRELLTRCAGPLDADVAGVAPAARLRGLGAFHRGLTLSLSGTRQFTGHGFAGTLTSTLVMRVISVSSLSGSGLFTVNGTGGSSGGGQHALREVVVSLRVLKSGGEIRSVFSGGPSPQACRLLASCGVHGALDLIPNPAGAVAELVAVGPARRPLRDFRAALGLRGKRGARPGDTRGISVEGTVDWLAGAVSESAGGCHDATASGGAGLDFATSGPRVHYGPIADVERTRCPGPLLALDGSEGGTFPRSLLTRRRIRLRVSHTIAFEDDGYVGEQTVRLSAVLARGKVTQSIFQAGNTWPQRWPAQGLAGGDG